MKTSGLIGGMRWESTAEYYRLLNELTRERLGGLHSAKCVLYSVDFAEIEQLQVAGRWDEAGDALAPAPPALPAASSDLVLRRANTTRQGAPRVGPPVHNPLLPLA